MACKALTGSPSAPTPAPRHRVRDLELILAADPRGTEQLFTSLLSVPGRPVSSLALSSVTKDALSSVTDDPRRGPMMGICPLITVRSPSLSGEFMKHYFKMPRLDMFKGKSTQGRSHENTQSEAMMSSGWERVCSLSASQCASLMCHGKLETKCLLSVSSKEILCVLFYK